MAKKNLKLFIPGAIALVLGIVAFCMMFVTGVTYTGKLLGSQVSISGMTIAFGGEIEIKDAASALFPIKELNFNIMTTLAFILPLVGGILALLFKNGLVTKIITTACFVVGAVFLFSTTGFITIGMEDDVAQQITEGGYEIGLGAGPIVAGILSVLGAIVCFFKGTIAKKFS